MKKYELLKATASTCDLLAKNNINPSDVEYLQLFEDWQRMCKEGHKKEYIKYYLSQQYGVSETSIWRICKRMQHEV